MRITLLILTLLASVFVGCYATGGAFTKVTPAAENGVVYFYRTSSFAASLTNCDVKINGQKVGSLGMNGYIARELKALNEYQFIIQCGQWRSKGSLTVEPGKSYYTKVDGGAVQWVDEPAALRELADLSNQG